MAERHGNEPTKIIALHGWGRSSADWRKTVSGLDALALDLPGFGATPPPEEIWDTEQYAQMLLPLLDENNPVTLIGHSFGGRVAVHMARLKPAGVNGLVLTGVPLLRADLPGGNKRTKPALKYRLVRWARKHRLVSEKTLEKLRREFGSDDYNAAKGVMRGILVKAVNEDYTPCLVAAAKNNIPVEFVWGENDPVVPKAVAEKAAQLLYDSGIQADVKVTLVPGSAHLLDEQLTAQLRLALERISST